MSRLGVITGLAREAACLVGRDREAVRVACAGAGPGRAERLARELVHSGCTALLSFGLAGGLDRRLGSGAVVVAGAVVGMDGTRWPTDPGWRDRLAGAVQGAFVGSIVGVDAVVTEIAAKAALAESSGALAVDMESHGVARAAAAAGVPFMAVRTIADPAGRAVPPWVTAAVAGDGRVRPWAALGGLLRHPADVRALLALADDARRGIAALRRVAAACPRLGLLA